MRQFVLLLSALVLLGCTGDENTHADSESSTIESTSRNKGAMIVVEPSHIQSNPEYMRPGDEHDLQVGDTVEVVGKETPAGVTYLRVHHDGIEGWLDESYALSSPEYYYSLQENGYDIMITSQAFSKGNSNEITLNVEFANISQERTVESGSVIWKLFNEGGDSVSTDTHGSTIESPLSSFSLPIPPRGFVSPAFDVGYSPEGSCAELRRIDLEMGNGESTKYEGESLRDISQEAENARLVGECR